MADVPTKGDKREAEAVVPAAAASTGISDPSKPNPMRRWAIVTVAVAAFLFVTLGSIAGIVYGVDKVRPACARGTVAATCARVHAYEHAVVPAAPPPPAANPRVAPAHCRPPPPPFPRRSRSRTRRWARTTSSSPPSRARS